MPTYEYECPHCLAWFEQVKLISERLSAQCPECGAGAELRPSRCMIIGDTCAGGVNYAGYDPVLKTELMGKTHRKEVMRQQGLKEYEPNPEVKAARDEAKYFRKHAPPGDYAARVIGGKLVSEAQDRVTKRHLSEGVDRAYKNVLDKV